MVTEEERRGELTRLDYLLANPNEQLIRRVEQLLQEGSTSLPAAIEQAVREDYANGRREATR